MHDRYAKNFEQSQLIDLIKNDATRIADCVKLTVHNSLIGPAVPDSRALDLRIAETNIKVMEYLGEELLRKPPLHNDQIECETTLDALQGNQIHKTLNSVHQTWVNLMEQEGIQAIVGRYDQYASKEKWSCTHDAISADLEKVTIIDRALLQECRTWHFDKK
jgi:hypothetical protein